MTSQVRGRARSTRQAFLGTIVVCTLAVIAFLCWAATFGGGTPEFPTVLFALSTLILKLAYPMGDSQNSPWIVVAWYGGAVVQWAVLGLLVDLVRWRLRIARDRRRRASF